MSLYRFLTLFAVASAALIPVCQATLPAGIPFESPAMSLGFTLAAAVESLLGERFGK